MPILARKSSSPGPTSEILRSDRVFRLLVDSMRDYRKSVQRRRGLMLVAVRSGWMWVVGIRSRFETATGCDLGYGPGSRLVHLKADRSANYRPTTGHHEMRGGGAAVVKLSVLMPVFNEEATLQTVLNRLPFKAVKRLKWLNFKLQCPVSPFHRVESWSAPDKCPRCGLYLEQNAIPYRIWE